MKICLVSPYDFMHPGGVTEHVRHLSAKLRARGHDVTVLAPSSRVGDDHGIPGYVRIGRSVPVRTNGSVARIALSFHLVRRVRALLDENDFDVVHYHEPLVPSLPITVLRFHSGANVGTFHAMARRNLGYYYGRPFLKRYFNRLHVHVAVSVPARDFIARYFEGEYRVVPNGIDCSRFNPNHPQLDELRTPGKATILFVGRLESAQGAADVCSRRTVSCVACAMMRASSWSAMARCAGDTRARSRRWAFPTSSSRAGCPRSCCRATTRPPTSSALRRPAARASASCCSRPWPAACR